jgi:hypothetical protein
VPAIGEHDEARLLAFQKFLDDHARAGRAHAVGDEHHVDRCVGLRRVLRDDDALACSKTICLDDDRRTVLLDVRVREARIRETRIARGGNAIAHHELLGVLLGAFEPCSEACRAEYRQPLRLECIDDPCGERRLGPDHRERDFLPLCEGDEKCCVGERDVRDAVFGSSARIAGSDIHFRRAFAARELPCERVLPPTGADHEDFHVRRTERGMRG